MEIDTDIICIVSINQNHCFNQNFFNTLITYMKKQKKMNINLWFRCLLWMNKEKMLVFLLMILLVNGPTISSSGNNSVLTANLIHFCRLTGMQYLVFCSMEENNARSARFLTGALREPKVVKSLRSRRLYHPKFEKGKNFDYHHIKNFHIL